MYSDSDSDMRRFEFCRPTVSYFPLSWFVCEDMRIVQVQVNVSSVQIQVNVSSGKSGSISCCADNYI